LLLALALQVGYELQEKQKQQLQGQQQEQQEQQPARLPFPPMASGQLPVYHAAPAGLPDLGATLARLSSPCSHPAEPPQQAPGAESAQAQPLQLLQPRSEELLAMSYATPGQLQRLGLQQLAALHQRLQQAGRPLPPALGRAVMQQLVAAMDASYQDILDARRHHLEQRRQQHQQQLPEQPLPPLGELLHSKWLESLPPMAPALPEGLTADSVISVLQCLLGAGLHHRAGTLTKEEQAALRLFRLCTAGQLELQLPYSKEQLLQVGCRDGHAWLSRTPLQATAGHAVQLGGWLRRRQRRLHEARALARPCGPPALPAGAAAVRPDGPAGAAHKADARGEAQEQGPTLLALRFDRRPCPCCASAEPPPAHCPAPARRSSAPSRAWRQASCCSCCS
jgi:hypothetical protein